MTFEFSTLLGRFLVWIDQPEIFDREWTLHEIADYHPDEVVGIIVADINGDGRPDLMTGAYSGGVLWLEQVRTGNPVPSFDRAREVDSSELESFHEP